MVLNSLISLLLNAMFKDVTAVCNSTLKQHMNQWKKMQNSHQPEWQNVNIWHAWLGLSCVSFTSLRNSGCQPSHSRVEIRTCCMLSEDLNWLIWFECQVVLDTYYVNVLSVNGHRHIFGMPIVSNASVSVIVGQRRIHFWEIHVSSYKVFCDLHILWPQPSAYH